MQSKTKMVNDFMSKAYLDLRNTARLGGWSFHLENYLRNCASIQAADILGEKIGYDVPFHLTQASPAKVLSWVNIIRNERVFNDINLTLPDWLIEKMKAKGNPKPCDNGPEKAVGGMP